MAGASARADQQRGGAGPHRRPPRSSRRVPPCLARRLGEAVGLPAGQMGNSEVGHMNLGAGRVVSRTSCASTSRSSIGATFTKPAFVDACTHVKRGGGTLHLLGLLGDGGVQPTGAPGRPDRSRRAAGGREGGDPRADGRPRHAADQRVWLHGSAAAGVAGACARLPPSAAAISGWIAIDAGSGSTSGTTA